MNPVLEFEDGAKMVTSGISLLWYEPFGFPMKWLLFIFSSCHVCGVSAIGSIFCLWYCRSIHFIFRQLLEILVEEKIESSIVACIHPTSGYARHWRAAQIPGPIYGLPWDDSSYTHFTIALWIIDMKTNALVYQCMDGIGKTLYRCTCTSLSCARKFQHSQVFECLSCTLLNFLFGEGGRSQ